MRCGQPTSMRLVMRAVVGRGWQDYALSAVVDAVVVVVVVVVVSKKRWFCDNG